MSSTPDAETDGETASDGSGAEGVDVREDATDGGYTHEPGTFDEDGEGVDESVHPATVDREFDWHGWVLIGTLILAFVVAPVTVYLRPPALPFWVSLIVMPLVPALVLGVVAVWATTRP